MLAACSATSMRRASQFASSSDAASDKESLGARLELLDAGLVLHEGDLVVEQLGGLRREVEGAVAVGADELRGVRAVRLGAQPDEVDVAHGVLALAAQRLQYEAQAVFLDGVEGHGGSSFL